MPTRALALWIEVVSWAFVVLGITLPLAFSTPAFALYRDALAAWAYGEPVIPAADHELLGLMLGITGGSIAGKWIVHALLARGPLAEGKAWARDLTFRGLAAWFLVDSLASLRLGAAFNVWMINLAPIALVGLPLYLSYGKFRDDHRAATAARSVGTATAARSVESATAARSVGTASAARSVGTATAARSVGTAGEAALSMLARACFWTSLLGATTGVAIAFGASTFLFAPWFRGLEAAHDGGASLADPARRLALFFFGPIGGCALAQFLMLAGFVRRDGGSARAAAAGTISIAVWFAVDSAWGIRHGGLFNIAMVNLPALLLTLPPWALMAARLRSTSD